MASTRERYQGEAGRHYHESKRAIPESALPWVARDRAGKLAPFVAAGSTVLEYGVGLGWNLAAIQCRRKIGCDVGEFLRPTLERQGIEFVINSQELPAGVAEVVLCHHALEHVLDPAAALAEMRRLLAPTGWLLVFVPLEREWRYRRFRREEPNHHVFSWNAQSLGNLVEDVGFTAQEVSVQRYGYDRIAAVWSARVGAGHWGFHALRATLRRLRPLLEVRLIARPAAAE